MQWKEGERPNHAITTQEAYLVPQESGIESRLEPDLATFDGTKNRIPINTANMFTVTGEVMATTMAQYGGAGVLPQHLPLDEAVRITEFIRSRHPEYETPVALKPDTDNATAVEAIFTRPHYAAVVTHDGTPFGKLLGTISLLECEQGDPSQSILFDENNVPKMKAGLTDDEMFAWFAENPAQLIAPVVEGDNLVGVMTEQRVIHNELFRPATNAGKLVVSAAVGINNDPVRRARALVKAGAGTIVVDTAHGHQKRMINIVRSVKEAIGEDAVLVAGNVVTAEGTNALIRAGADIVKVGVGPGAMCTTRMMTGFGRPQLSAAIECAATAKELGKFTWADGGIRYPRDVALLIAGGSDAVMIGSWFNGALESPGKLHRNKDGWWKGHFGSASGSGVRLSYGDGRSLRQLRRQLFEEGQDNSRSTVDRDHPSVTFKLQKIVTGLLSALAYAGAVNLNEYHARAVIGTQSAHGFTEGDVSPF